MLFSKKLDNLGDSGVKVVCKNGVKTVSRDVLLAFYPLFSSSGSYFSKSEAIFLPDFSIDDLNTVIMLPLLGGR